MDQLEELRQKFREEMNELTDGLATGNCSTLEQYRYETGKIRGLAEAERMLIDLKQRLERDDD